MSVLDSLPDRPLRDAELASFNRSDAIEMAVEVSETEGEGIDGVLLATEDWVKGLAYEDEGWRVVESVSLGDGENERYEGMRACESAVREALD
ncbi:hypothetical protein SY89_01359 [Halolamina pelagica]|uniref:DUF7964 domain-containing protein n=1 Tax=Halolamina pelagica TaxID=699431 RepID=A0A0P7HV14_9EURY|nr:hypothetical protein [Halolamina pelagica]KPN30623.1 hypothetical protein SY89_01359 [Halolamina pelagica]